MEQFLSHYEKLLMEKGFSALSSDEKNGLVIEIARQQGVPFIDISQEDVLTHHKDLKIEYLREHVEAEIIAGFTATNGHVYRTNRDDQINMIGQRDELNEDATITEVDWKTEDAGYLTHTREDWLTIYKEAFLHKKIKLGKYNTLKQQTLNSTTHDELILITW